MKRALIITAAAIVVLGIAVGAYFLFFAPKGAELTVGGNPFDSATGSDAGPQGDVPLGQGAGTEVAPRFIRITDGPVAPGFLALGIERTTTEAGATTTTKVPDTEIRYVDRASGNTYAFVVHARNLARLSNKTLPGIQEASWLSDGSMAYLRFVTRDSTNGEHVMSYALPVNGEGGYFLQDDLAMARAASSSLFTLLAGTSGSVGTVARGDGTNARTLFNSPLSFLTVVPATSGYFAHTRPSAQVDGYGFSIASNGTFTRLLGPLRGLAILPSPNGKNVLYTYMDRGTPRLALLDVASRAATALPLATFTEKCVWTQDTTAVYCAVPTNLSGALPDDWYQGAVTFTDRIWRVDLALRTATLVMDPNQIANTPIDAVSLTIDPKADTLTFMDRATGSLWVYDL